MGSMTTSETAGIALEVLFEQGKVEKTEWNAFAAFVDLFDDTDPVEVGTGVLCALVNSVFWSVFTVPHEEVRRLRVTAAGVARARS